MEHPVRTQLIPFPHSNNANNASSTLTPPDNDNEVTVRLRRKKSERTQLDLVTEQQQQQKRPVSLMDRMSKLQVAQNSWQARVTEKDNSRLGMTQYPKF